ncbi:hypothetical protein GWI33_004801 [Rhynchophorus ferrugineus]|uniref:Retinoblastoma-like protein 1 n=1 Tax=Rhynchophorus ferrugineus TaxID=354439 RepID=A0A834IL79_RHYFE|nr:hypothetical protein GWI33_004801 [Rhynchophorus ferrugineus]
MVLSSTTEDKLYKIHLDLCGKLNLDSNIITASWETFQSIHKNFGLEGEKLNWIGCSIYAASRNVETSTVDTSSVVRGVGLNLTTLLRHSNLSFSQFFDNITTWAKMAQLPDEFTEKVINLRTKFSITYNVFKTFSSRMFTEIFVSPAPNNTDMEANKHRNRKNRSIPCTPHKIFEFIWNLFIVLKTQEPSCSIELIKSYHLLYCCIDLAFQNVIAANRKELLNTAYAEEYLPYNSNSDLRVPCLVEHFCKNDTMIKEALHMKVYVFGPLISKFVEDNSIIADKNHLGILSYENFDQNFRNVTNVYDTYVLSHGEIDEKIFLAEHKRVLLEKGNDTSIIESPRNNADPLTPGTPLTCRKYLGPRENVVSSTSVAEKMSRLHALVNNRTAAPSDNLKRIFESCGKDPTETIESVISTISERFIGEYTIINSSNDDAQSKLNIAITLFYKYIEFIFEKEQKISIDISAVVDKEIFYQGVLACCAEIVLYCYNFPKKFPWIIDALQIESVQFVKVIELIVRCKDNLFRELIKHLKWIEETIIESLAWKSDSPIWLAIERSGQPIPKNEDVALPGQLLYTDATEKQNIQCPASPSANDVFQSPSPQICKNLFPSPGQSSVQHIPKHAHAIILGKDKNIKLIQLTDSDKRNGNNRGGSPGLQPDQSPATVKPKRTGSIAIIYRKFYYLASLRLEELYSHLDFVNFELKRKIWTIFEYSIRETDLIKDRHLDQLLMCAIYVICKACNVNITFASIMKYYRYQPQASSSVYRDVFIERRIDGETISEERGDLINFYNSVYVKVLQSYVVRLQPNSNSRSNIILSPLLAKIRNSVSPSQAVIDNVFIKPLEITNSPSEAIYNYYFSRSPSKDLKNINRAINNNGVQGKRLLTEEDTESQPASKKICNRKIQSLVEDRLRQNTE